MKLSSRAFTWFVSILILLVIFIISIASFILVIHDPQCEGKCNKTVKEK